MFVSSNILDDHVFVDTTNSRRKRARTSIRASLITKQTKLDAVLDQIEKKNLNLRQLFHVLDKHRSQERYRKYWSQFRKFAYKDMFDDNIDHSKLKTHEWDHILTTNEYDKIHHQLRKKLVKLSDNRQIARWQYLNDEFLNYIEDIEIMINSIKDIASILVRLLSIIAQSSKIEFMNMSHRQIMWVLMF